MEFSINIRSDDDHAASDPRGLTVSSLGDIAKLVEVGQDQGVIRDDNGNRVGNWILSVNDNGPIKPVRSSARKLG